MADDGLAGNGFDIGDDHGNFPENEDGAELAPSTLNIPHEFCQPNSIRSSGLMAGFNSFPDTLSGAICKKWLEFAVDRGILQSRASGLLRNWRNKMKTPDLRVWLGANRSDS